MDHKSLPMKTLLPILLTAAVLTLAARCEPEDEFILGESFTLAQEEVKTNHSENLSVQWAKVLEDSRCPKYMNCVWEGQVRVMIVVNEEEVELTLRAGRKSGASASVGAFRVQMQALEPYPEAEVERKPEDYRLQLLVNKAP